MLHAIPHELHLTEIRPLDDGGGNFQNHIASKASDDLRPLAASRFALSRDAHVGDRILHRSISTALLICPANWSGIFLARPGIGSSLSQKSLLRVHSTDSSNCPRMGCPLCHTCHAGRLQVHVALPRHHPILQRKKSRAKSADFSPTQLLYCLPPVNIQGRLTPRSVPAVTLALNIMALPRRTNKLEVIGQFGCCDINYG
jgi:hypothetical protein